MEETLVKFSDIKKSYPGKNVLNGVSFEISKGSVHGFLGPNGAGKSTLMNILLEQIEKSSGKIEFFGDVRIGYLPENLPLYMTMRVLDYLKFVQNIYNQKDNEYLEEIIDKCGLREMAKRMIAHLSKGYKQRVALAGALCHNPDLLVLDEPMVGLDPHAIIKMKDLILSLSKDHTIFISSHQLNELAQICDRISILNEGVIVKSGTIDDVEKEINLNQVVDVELLKLDDLKVIEEFVENEGIAFEQVSDLNFRFTSIKKDDLRLVLSQFFSENGITVLSQSVKKMNLEEIFKSTTSGGSL